MKSHSSEFQLGKFRLDELRGQWVAAIDRVVVEHDEDLKNVVGKVKGKKATYAHIPKSHIAMY